MPVALAKADPAADARRAIDVAGRACRAVALAKAGRAADTRRAIDVGDKLCRPTASWRYRCGELGDGEGLAADFEGLGEETGADAEGTGLAVYLAFASSIFEASPWFCGSSFKAFCQ